MEKKLEEIVPKPENAERKAELKRAKEILGEAEQLISSAGIHMAKAEEHEEEKGVFSGRVYSREAFEDIRGKIIGQQMKIDQELTELGEQTVFSEK